MNNFALEKKDEHKAVLISVDTGEFDAELSIAELMELAETAGVKTEFYVIQKRPTYDSATCIGAGRLKDVAEQAEISGVDLAIFDCELTANQTKNIENILDMQVIDRTTLILDIFAQRAMTKEAAFRLNLLRTNTDLLTLQAVESSFQDLAEESAQEARVNQSLRPTGDI